MFWHTATVFWQDLTHTVESLINTSMGIGCLPEKSATSATADCRIILREGETAELLADAGCEHLNATGVGWLIC